MAYYDPNLSITWLADANLAKSNSFGLPSFRIEPDGSMSTINANLWLAAMNNDGGTGYLEAIGWRFPSMDVNGDGVVVNCANADEATCKDNEMGYLFHVENIGVSGYVPNKSPEPFDHLQGLHEDAFGSPTTTGYYRSNTLSTGSLEWHFNYILGFNFENVSVEQWAWPVHDGDVFASTVPIPPAVWLLGSGLVGLVGVARKNAA